MTQMFQCGETTELVAYVYGEGAASMRAAIAAHLSNCVACTAEVATLRATRSSLTSWAPPETSLGFQIVNRHELGSDRVRSVVSGLPETRPQRWHSRPVPLWAQAVAAMLILAVGVALGVASGRSIARTGGTAQAVGDVGGSISAADLAALEQRLREDLGRPQPVTAAAPREVAPGVSEAQLLARVQALIEESERRQQRELALRTAQVVRDFDSQRRLDLAQIQRSFGQIEGVTGAEVREQRQMLNYLIRASEQR